MLRKELSLIINSLLVQFAAGIFIAMALSRVILLTPGSSDIAERGTLIGMTVAGPVLMLSMLASLFHLGNPLRAYRAITNMGASWLSREIFFTGGFLALWCVFIFMETAGMQVKPVMILTGLAGLVSIISMAGIYYSTGKTGWYSINTYIDFIGSTVVFGCAGFSVIIMTFGKGDPVLNGLIKPAGIILTAAVSIKLLQLVILLSSMKDEQHEWSMDSFVSGEDPSGKWIAMFKILSFSGIAVSLSGGILLLAVPFFSMNGASEAHVYISALLVITGETVSRTGFYSLGVENSEKDVKPADRHDAYGRYIPGN